MDYSSQHKPIKVNQDVDPKYLPEDTSFYMLNSERNLTGSNASLGKTTPLAANEVMCEVDQPGGETYSTGSHYSSLINEEFSFVYNSNNVHYIQRIKSNGKCEIVYHDPCLELSADPKHAMMPWRSLVQLEKVCANRDGKYLVWANGLRNIGWLDVEAAAKTNSFSTPFFEICPDPCAYWQLCVPQPCGCLHAEFVPLPDSEVGLTNTIVEKGIKVMFRHITYDLRASEWSDRSTLYFQDIKGCFDNASGLPRCLKMRVPIGNPMVDRIEIGYSIDNGATWQLYDTVEKYKKYNNSQQFWYERELSEQVSSTFSEDDCAFDYFFCNDKQCQPIDPKEITRVRNPIPQYPQGLIRIKNSLGFYNYVDGNCPFDQSEAQKFQLSLKCDEQDCPEEYAKVTVRAVIYNFESNRMQFVYRMGGADDSVPDDPTDTALFGGLQPALDGGFDTGYDQQFVQKTRNFIAYVDATEYWAEMKQWYTDSVFSRRYEVGVIGNMESVKTKNRYRRAAINGEFLYQEAIIKVKKGTKGFIRLASQKATGNEQNTSTYVVATLNDIRDYRGNAISAYDLQSEEIYFDTCNGDVELFQSFVIQDNAADTEHETAASAYYGYITDLNGRPVEGALLLDGGNPVSRTDHNGFYHFYLFPGTADTKSIGVEVEQSCSTSGGFAVIEYFNVSGQPQASSQIDYQIKSETYRDNLYAIVKQEIVDCNGDGIGGIRVSISGSKYEVTDGFGVATFRIRNYPTRNRQVRTIVIDHNGCFSLDCSDDCDSCMPSRFASTVPCYFGKPVVTLAELTLNIDSLGKNKKGLKAGGNYPFGFILQGECNKLSAVYPTKNLVIPKTQEKGDLSFCSIGYDGTGMLFPDGFTCLKIVRGVNLNPYELQWVIDKKERTSDGKIKLTIQSLNDYNAKYNFKTNTIYQWLKGDRVEFIRNGDGKILSILENGLLNYLTLSPFNDEVLSGIESVNDVNYFNQLLIDDDGRLDGITPGAIIELQRPAECQVEPTYYEICSTLFIGADHKLEIPVGEFTSFDTFLVQRSIGTSPAQTFEHKNPSDFWGVDGGLSDIGKAHFVNQYENERRYGRNISLNAPGQPNYFGDTVKTFEAPEQGDITAMAIVDGQIILAIGEIDSFLAQASNDLVRVGSNGIVRAANPDDVISDGEPKLSGVFGCKYEDIGSVFFGDGYAMFADIEKDAYVKHNYQIAVDASLGKMKSYFKYWFQKKRQYNGSELNFLNHYRFATGINLMTGAVALTLKRWTDPAINNDTKPFVSPYTTMLFEPNSEDFLGNASFIPESYSYLDLSDNEGCAFLVYFKGIPFLHTKLPTKFNEFFGIAVDRVIGICLNKYKEKIKVPIAGEIQDDTMWFVHEVTTTDTSFMSEVPPIKIYKSERLWKFDFLRDKNSRGGIFAGPAARDYAILVTLIRDNTDGLKYGTINNGKRVLYDELDLVTFKYLFSEQSGMTVNL